MSPRPIARRKDLAALNATAMRAVCVALLCVLAAATTGCNDGRKPGTARIQGKITIDGQPPPAGAIGSIAFRPKDKGQPTSAQIVDGKYDCENVPLADVDVLIQLVQPTGRMVSDGGRMVPELRNLVSSKYDTGVSLKITDDNSNQDFELEGNTSPQ